MCHMSSGSCEGQKRALNDLELEVQLRATVWVLGTDPSVLDCPPHLAFEMNAGDLNSGPLACVANTFAE